VTDKIPALLCTEPRVEDHPAPRYAPIGWVAFDKTNGRLLQTGKTGHQTGTAKVYASEKRAVLALHHAGVGPDGAALQVFVRIE